MPDPFQFDPTKEPSEAAYDYASNVSRASPGAFTKHIDQLDTIDRETISALRAAFAAAPKGGAA